MNKMAKLAIMAQFQYGQNNWQKQKFIQIYDKFSPTVKNNVENIYFIKLMAKMILTPDIGYH